MDKQIRKVVATGVEAKYLNVPHVRQPSQRVPIPRITGRKGPGNRLQGQAVLNVWVLGKILGVVEVVKLVVLDGPIQEDRDEPYQEADDSNPGSIARMRFLRFALHSCGRITLQIAAAKPILRVLLNFVAKLRNSATHLKSAI